MYKNDGAIRYVSTSGQETGCRFHYSNFACKYDIYLETYGGEGGCLPVNFT